MSTNSIIWMGDIEPKMTELDIMKCFYQYNIRPQGIKLIKDKKTNENKNFCFINFKSIKEANGAIFKLNGKKVPGYPFVFRLNWANNRSSFNKSVYVGNLNPQVDDIKLYNLFKKKYPTVHHASIITENGISKGYGFVMFNGKEEYEKSIKEMNGINFYGNIIKVKEQKKKDNKNKKLDKSIENDDNSSLSNDSENNFEKKKGSLSYKNNELNNNIGNSDINKSMFKNISLGKINNNQIKCINNSVNNLNNFPNDIVNNIEIKSNNIYKNFINNTNFSTNYYNYNISNNKILYSPTNNNNNNNKEILKKSNYSNNSIVSLNSINSEQMSNYSTAERFTTQQKPKKSELEILNPIDENTLFKKIHEGVYKLFKNYQESISNGNKKVNCKYILFNIFWNSIKYVSLLFIGSANTFR